MKFGGDIHSLFSYDTRQNVSAREGHIYLYPKDELLDANGKDINEGGVFNLASIRTRFNAKITGPDVLGAKTNGLIEADFIGMSNKNVNGVRLRHAYINLSWGKTSLLVGQTWSPLFVTEVFPGTVGANTGLPFKPFARNPQIRLTHRTANWKFLAALATERDHRSTGPDGSSTKYLQNAGLPIIQGQVHYYAGKHIIGASAEFKTIKPALSSITGTKEADNLQNWDNDETLSSWAMMGYFKLDFNPITFKAQATYGSNMTDVLMLGGYAVKSLNTITNEASYTPIKVLGTWADLSYNKNDYEFALLAAFSKNYGADDKLALNADGEQMIYSRGSTIGELYRIAPRVSKKINQLKIELEVEHTAAAYADKNGMNEKAEVIHSHWVANTRVMLGLCYFF